MPKGNLTPAEKHQLKIALKTLKMPDAMAGVMGGMTKEEARDIIEELTGQRPAEALSGVHRLRLAKRAQGNKRAGLIYPTSEALKGAIKAEVRRQYLSQRLSRSRAKESGRYTYIRFKGGRSDNAKASQALERLASQKGIRATRQGSTVQFPTGIDQGTLYALLDSVYGLFPEGEYPVAHYGK